MFWEYPLWLITLPCIPASSTPNEATAILLAKTVFQYLLVSWLAFHILYSIHIYRTRVQMKNWPPGRKMIRKYKIDQNNKPATFEVYRDGVETSKADFISCYITIPFVQVVISYLMLPYMVWTTRHYCLSSDWIWLVASSISRIAAFDFRYNFVVYMENIGRKFREGGFHLTWAYIVAICLHRCLFLEGFVNDRWLNFTAYRWVFRLSLIVDELFEWLRSMDYQEL